MNFAGISTFEQLLKRTNDCTLFFVLILIIYLRSLSVYLYQKTPPSSLVKEGAWRF
jgi:hypothetical protein